MAVFGTGIRIAVYHMAGAALCEHDELLRPERDVRVQPLRLAFRGEHPGRAELRPHPLLHHSGSLASLKRRL